MAWEFSLGFSSWRRIRVCNTQYMDPLAHQQGFWQVLSEPTASEGCQRPQPWTGLEIHPCHAQRREKEVLQFLPKAKPVTGPKVCPQNWCYWRIFRKLLQQLQMKPPECLALPSATLGSWKTKVSEGRGLCCCKSPKSPDGNKKTEINRKELFQHCNDSSWWLHKALPQLSWAEFFIKETKVKRIHMKLRIPES